MKLSQDNQDLIKKFGATPITKLSSKPSHPAFENGTLASHRDFDKFFLALKKKEKCAILSGLNASGTLHLAHKAVFDVNLFFQKKYNIPVFYPINFNDKKNPNQYVWFLNW